MSLKIKEELDRCKKDPIYFIENYIKLDLAGKLINMKLREKQKEIIKNYLNDHYVIILGSRQTGKSMVTLAFILWLVMFYESYTVYIIHKGESYTKDHIRDIRLMYDRLPSWMKYKIVKKSPLYLEFSNKSRVSGVNVPRGKEGDTGRGLRGGFIFIDEAAFQSDLRELLTGIGPSATYIHNEYKRLGIPYGMTLVSTPNGRYDNNGNIEPFYEMWIKALNGEGIYKPIKYHWSEVPEFMEDPEEFKRIALERLNGDIRKYNQEYELVFLGREHTFLNDDTIAKLDKLSRDPEFIVNTKFGELYVYEKDLFDRIAEDKIDDIYICGVDIGSQYGSDPSTMVFMRLSDMKVVADYVNKLPIKNFRLDIIYVVNRLFLNKALLAIERTNISEEMIEQLQDSVVSDLIIYGDKKPGINMNKATKPKVMDSLRRQVEEYPESVVSKRLAQQLITLERNPRTGKIEVPRGLNHHGDLAIGFGLCCYTTDYLDISDYIYYMTSNNIEEGVELLKKLINNSSKTYSNEDDNSVNIQLPEIQELDEIPIYFGDNNGSTNTNDKADRIINILFG